jgi:heme/copper-type cytochrome/quinol oxidase subunit 1
VHPLRHPRNAIVVGLMFAGIGAIYWLIQEVTGFRVDYAGVTMLFLLGVAVSIMAYVLIAGSPND